MIRFFSSFLVLFTVILSSQNKQILYGFDNIPQTLLLNPGAKANYKYHVGVPLLSGISAQGNMSGFTIADLFRNDNVDFNTKLDNVLNQLDNNDYIALNTQVDIVNAGYQMNDKDYLSVGFYTELDAFSTIPKDFLELLRDGNAPNLNRNFLFSRLSIKGDVLGVLHAGISRKFSKRLTAGVRLKIYSGSLNVLTNDNQGSFTTRLGTNGIYEHTLSGLDLAGYSSGIVSSDNQITIDVSDVLGNTFFGPNLGLGIDIGFTYQMDEQTEFSASLLDIGFVHYSDQLRNGTVTGGYVFSGIEFQYDGSNPNYWQDLNDDISSSVPRSENSESYSVMRPMKFNAALHHYFGKSRREESCFDISSHSYYDNAVGAQLYSVIRPIGPQFAFTGFYQRKFSEKVSSRVTYTVDDFSHTNFGIGMSVHIWKINLYGAVDNIFNLSDIANANSASVQFGINILFK
ncbi:hypothetical protein BTO06_11495 [Tenacibaculum sp. SZ-18]|uniref:DUF5723 family protein n=1 Tax=Tenacibaculum sp. SZ-18 TaxID=754423 RepID=UPI000C2CEE33|nr:DUF5723 family protein [Tenacibaculum sp. SZ-18]AUC15735.1 hypothetical protein BTO06_11495 [Tenacibaculum sp. SZ-18]